MGKPRTPLTCQTKPEYQCSLASAHTRMDCSAPACCPPPPACQLNLQEAQGGMSARQKSTGEAAAFIKCELCAIGKWSQTEAVLFCPHPTPPSTPPPCTPGPAGRLESAISNSCRPCCTSRSLVRRLCISVLLLLFLVVSNHWIPLGIRPQPASAAGTFILSSSSSFSTALYTPDRHLHGK